MEYLKLLNAELTDQVQKLRLEAAAYRSYQVQLQQDYFKVREEMALERKVNRSKILNLIKHLMRDHSVDIDDITESMELDSLPTETRRTSREMSRDNRRSCELLASKFVSPSSRRTSGSARIRELSQEEMDCEDSVSSEPPDEEAAEETPPDAIERTPEKQYSFQGHMPCINEILTPVNNSSSVCNDDTEVVKTPVTVRNASSIRSRVLQEVNTNTTATIDHNKTKKIPSIIITADESLDMSIQPARHAVGRHSYSPAMVSSDSLQHADPPGVRKNMSRAKNQNGKIPLVIPDSESMDVSVISLDDSSLMQSPRRSQFEASAAKTTSTPNTSVAAKPRKESSKCKSKLESSSTTPVQRPSRRCRPAELKEPSLRDKMRNDSSTSKKKEKAKK
ncbi:hypothetical protein KR074_008863 [Drosophila pseudoananassae]|nr:hypothetical protein KR074_008863 [Drosophila pseudoananassae]